MDQHLDDRLGAIAARQGITLEEAQSVALASNVQHRILEPEELTGMISLLVGGRRRRDHRTGDRRRRRVRHLNPHAATGPDAVRRDIQNPRRDGP